MSTINTSPILTSNPLLSTIESVSSALKSTELSVETYPAMLEGLHDKLQVIQQRLSCSADEAWLFAVYFTKNVNDRKVTVRDINNHLECEALFSLRLVPIVASLMEKRLLREYTLDDVWYEDDEGLSNIPPLYVPPHVVKHVVQGSPLGNGLALRDEYHFLEQIAKVAEQYRSVRHTSMDMVQETLALRQEASRFDMVRLVEQLNLCVRDQLILYLLAFYALLEQEEELKFFIGSVTKNLMEKAHLKRAIINGEHPLLVKGYAQIKGGGIMRDNQLELSPYGIERLLGFNTKLAVKAEPRFHFFTAIKPEKIGKVQLYYPEQVQEEVRTLQRYCATTNFRRIYKRLKQEQLPLGLNILLHGKPGTGKTELVRQIARQTKRVLLTVEMSDIKEKWVGESEKNVKVIFNDYKRAIRCYKKAPILLLNEADALISKRQTVQASDNGVRDMLNTMQNILLQELEDFKGILIATTNRVQSFDPAFERRFLYKVRVTPPNPAARSKIWKNRFPKLSKASLEELGQLPLTGGQISNVARKAAVQKVLEGIEPHLEQLKALAQLELGQKEIRQPVGFRLTA